MAKRLKINTTKLQIIRESTKMMIEKGYTETTFRAIAAALDINPGLITFYFPTKENLLAIVVDKLCDFQWRLMYSLADDGVDPLLALSLELMAMAAISEEEASAKDFFVSAYQSSVCLELIQQNDTLRAKQIFTKYNPTWTDEDFRCAEALVSGIEYATLNTNSNSAELETRIKSALKTIFSIYNVPDSEIIEKLDIVSRMDYRSVGRRIFKEFKEYIDSENKNVFDKIY